MVVAIAKPQTQRYTAEEYLVLEMESDIRNEYQDGEIVPMAGGTPNHNQITVVLNGLLWVGLRGKPYRIFNADQRLWLPDRNLYTYPDAMVIEHPVTLQPGRKDTVMNPILIVEVLSDSTKAYDRGDKFAAYRSIPTFQEYVLIDQTQFHVEHYVKQSTNQWLFTEYDGPDTIVSLASVAIEIPFADLYENVEFEDRQA